tara:strand:+ start:819 stop:1106 length:288 start_codon:yes stop_codon:yes gene_type:complete
MTEPLFAHLSLQLEKGVAHDSVSISGYKRHFVSKDGFDGLVERSVNDKIRNWLIAHLGCYLDEVKLVGVEIDSDFALLWVCHRNTPAAGVGLSTL